MSDELKPNEIQNKTVDKPIKKPRPPLTEKQLENLRRGREMNPRTKEAQERGRMTQKQNSVIRKYQKEQEKINREKEYNRIMAEKNAKLAPPPEPEEKEEKPLSKLQKPKPKPKPESEEEEEEEVIIKKPIAKKPITEEQLYSKANIEMLRNRLYQQTRQRLKNDMFNY